MSLEDPYPSDELAEVQLRHGVGQNCLDFVRPRFGMASPGPGLRLGTKISIPLHPPYPGTIELHLHLSIPSSIRETPLPIHRESPCTTGQPPPLGSLVPVLS